jgi:multidrug resistance efflux pump
MKTAARVLLTLVIVAGAAFGAHRLWDYYMYSAWTRDGRVQADVVSIAPDVAGFVHEIRVKDNQFVHKGDVLLVLDQDRYKLALATAAANVEARRAQMEMQQHMAERREKLTTLSTSIEEKQNATYTASAAVGTYQQALADLATARLNLNRTVIYAPVNGYVTNLTLDVGQYASVGTKVIALIDSDSYRVMGYFEETKIPKVQPGQRVKVYMMSGGSPLGGHVEGISRGITDRDNENGPELLANVTPTFEWVRLAQRIPVRIQIDSVPAGVHISAGMTCTVVAETPPRVWPGTLAPKGAGPASPALASGQELH